MRSSPGFGKINPQFLFIILLFSYSNGLAVNEAGAPFLTLSPSARADGMSGAFTAIANDLGAMYYNPAGLTQIKNSALEYNYNNWIPPYFSGISYHFFGGAYHLTNTAVIGLSAIFHSYGEILISDYYSVQSKVKKSYEKCFTLSVAQKLTPNLSFGLSGKYIRIDFWNYGFEGKEMNSWATAIDIGLLYQNIFPNACYRQAYSRKFSIFPVSHRIPPGFSLGISLQNIGSKLTYIDVDQTDPLPQTLRLGAAWNCVDTQILGLTLSWDAEKLLVRRKKDGSSDPALKAIFTAWADRPFNEELEEMIFHSGLEANLTQYGAIRFGKYSDSEGNRTYSNFGFSVGPDTARFSMSTFMFEEHGLFDNLFFSFALTY